MNAIDMFTCLSVPGDVITYYPKKTTSRRADRAKMKICIEPCITPLVEKYIEVCF
jgi:hypothetical protein